MNMNPSPSSSDIPYRMMRYSESFSQFCICTRMKNGLNFFDLFIGKFRASMLSTPKNTTAFQQSIFRRLLNVLLLRANSYVSRIHTPFVIALLGMKRIKPFWNRAVRQFVGYPMRCGLLSVFNGEHSVSASIESGFPRPAFIWPTLVHLWPETFSDRFWFWSRSHVGKNLMLPNNLKGQLLL